MKTTQFLCFLKQQYTLGLSLPLAGKFGILTVGALALFSQTALANTTYYWEPSSDQWTTATSSKPWATASGTVASAYWVNGYSAVIEANDAQVTLGSNSVALSVDILTINNGMTVIGSTAAVRQLTITGGGSGNLTWATTQTSNTARLILSATSAWNGTLTLAGAGVGYIAINNNVSTNETTNLVINAGSVRITTGSVTLGSLAGSAGSIYNSSTSGTSTINVVQSANTTYAGTIANNGASGKTALTKSGAGTLTLTGQNTYTGATTVSAGELDVNGSLAAGSPVSVSGATLAGSGTVGGVVSASNATINGSGLTIGATTLHGLSALSGYNIASSVTVAGGTTTLTGTTRSTSTLSVGVGATLNSNGTIDGNATISGFLKGNSTITGTLSLTSGTLSSGNSAGITTINKDFTMDGNSTLVAEISGTVAGSSYDQVKVSGNVSLSGTLDLRMLSGLALGDTVTLIENTGNGTTLGYFSSILTSGSTYTVTTSGSTYTFAVGSTEYEINYSANTDAGSVYNDVTLTVVPEPASWAMLVGGIGMLAFGQRLRRRRE